MLLGDSLWSTDGKVIASYEGIKLVSTDGNRLGAILGNVDSIILGLDVRTELGYLDGSFDGSTVWNLGGLFFWRLTEIYWWLSDYLW